MWSKSCIRIVLICALLLLAKYALRPFHSTPEIAVVLSFASIHIEPHRLDDRINIGFSLFEFEQAKVKEAERTRDFDLTVILQYRKNVSNVKKLIQHARTNRLLKAIIVWDSSAHANLTIDQLDNNNQPPGSFIRIIRADHPLNATRYHTCLQANTSVCYVVDDDHDRLYYINSLTAGYRSDPTMLHFVVDPRTFEAQTDWSDRHPWTAYGSLFPRTYAKRHVQLLRGCLSRERHWKLAESDVERIADALFPSWFDGAVPYLVANAPLTSPTNYTSPATLDFCKTAHVQHRNATQRGGHTSSPVRSAGFDDDLIFYTNIPSDSSWHAVDGDLSTCWQSSRLLRPGDYFAVDFLRSQMNLTFVLTVSHSRLTQAKLEVSISFNGVWWIPYRSLNGIYTRMSRTPHTVYLFDAALFNLGFRSFRYVKFQAIAGHSTSPLSVCDIRLASEADRQNDFQPLA